MLWNGANMNKLTKWINDKLGVTKLHAKLQVLVGENRRLETELNKLQNEFHSMDRIDIDCPPSIKNYFNFK